MLMRRTETGDSATAGECPPGKPFDRPNLSGDLDELLGLRPVFKVRPRGYDRLQVDNYAAWAESELLAARREVDHLLSCYAACSAELEISRRLLADAPRSRESFPVTDRVDEMLRLASDEAAALTDAAAQEAEEILAEARTEADARLRKAHAIKEMAVESADELCAHARRERAEAAAALEAARREATELLRAAAAERDRLDADARSVRERATAAAAARLADVQEEVDDLRRQRDEARQSLRTLTDQIGQALQAVLTTVPDDLVVLAGRIPVPS